MKTSKYDDLDDFFDGFDDGVWDDEDITYKYDINGVILEMNRKLTNDEIYLISLISINGSKFYDKCFEYGKQIDTEFDNRLSVVVKQLRRNETIDLVLNNKK